MILRCVYRVSNRQAKQNAMEMLPAKRQGDSRDRNERMERVRV